MLVIEEIGIGAGVGLVLTLLGAWLLKQRCCARMDHRDLASAACTALAVTCFALAQILGGSGFIAAFAGGLLFGAIAKEHKPKLPAGRRRDGRHPGPDHLGGVRCRGGRSVDRCLQLAGGAVCRTQPDRGAHAAGFPGAMAGMNLRSDEKLFMGWFGPRGLASIVFAVIVLRRPRRARGPRRGAGCMADPASGSSA